MRVVVVGAGPAGLATAVGLGHHGHDVVLLERSPTPRAGGGAVTLTCGGTAALASLGVEVDRLGRRLEVLDSRTAAGVRLLRVPLGRLGRQVGTPTTSVPRSVLVAALVDLLPDDVLRTGADVDVVDPYGPVVHLLDGSALAADVVVGADGARSPVRRALRPGAVPRRTGWTTWQGCTRPGPGAEEAVRAVVDGDEVLFRTGPEGFAVLQPAGDGLLQWSFSTPAGTVAPTAPLAALRARFERWAPPVPAVLAGAAEEPTAWPHRSTPVPRVWGSGAVTLVGDAAHVMPPSLGQGVNQALEDAHALVAALAGGPGGPAVTASAAPAALRAVERRRAGQVRPLAWAAGTEAVVTDAPLHRWAQRLLPDAWALRLWSEAVRRTSPAIAARPAGARHHDAA